MPIVLSGISATSFHFLKLYTWSGDCEGAGHDRPSTPRKNRITQQQIREATGENPVFGTMNDCPPEVEEEFLKRVLAYEIATKKPLMDALLECGVAVPAPDELSDAQLSDKLWEIIHGLQSLRVMHRQHRTAFGSPDVRCTETLTRSDCSP